jgi:hypothetical protein
MIKKLTRKCLRRAVDAFAFGLRRSDLVEELGRTKPRAVLDLMEIANRFTDREDSYHSKRESSPEYDRSSRQHNQRRRSGNEDGRTMRNQVATGYKRRDGEGDEQENDEYHKKDNSIRDWSKYFDPSAEEILHRPCPIHYAYLDGKRVSNHLMRYCRTFLKLQETMELSQGAKLGYTTYDTTTTYQGYQIESGTGYP